VTHFLRKVTFGLFQDAVSPNFAIIQKLVKVYVQNLSLRILSVTLQFYF